MIHFLVFIGTYGIVSFLSELANVAVGYQTDFAGRLLMSLVATIIAWWLSR